MYKAAVNIKLTPDYWQALMENPDSDRETAVSKTIDSVGGILHFLGLHMGNGTLYLLLKVHRKKRSCRVL